MMVKVLLYGYATGMFSSQGMARKLEGITQFLAFSVPTRQAIHTTNAIKSLNSTVRRAVQTRGRFPNVRAVAKLIYLALRNVWAKWQKTP